MGKATPQRAPRDPNAELRELVAGYQPAVVILTASRLGLFERLTRSPKTPEQLAHAVPADLRALRRVLDALLGLSLLAWEGERIAIAPRFAEALDPSNPDSIAGAFDHHANCFDAWAQLESVVLDGSPRLGPPDAQDPARARAFHHAMRAFGREGAQELLRAVDWRRIRRVLDVGGGTAVIAAEVCRRQSHLHWTILDRPAAAALARRRIQSDGLAGRVVFVQGEALRDPWPEGHDAVLFSHLIHAFDDGDTRALIGRAADVLPPRGLLIVRDFISRRSGVPDRQAGLFGINMLVNTPAGRVYSLPELRRLLAPAFRVERLVTPARAQVLLARRR